MSGGGRTVWRAKDAAWWRREWIVELGEEFGAAGPSVIDWLECEAKSQNDGGRVKAGPRTVARGCFVDLVTVGHVLSRSVTLGLLVDYEDKGGRFECRISWWQADQDKSSAAIRKARQRAANTGDSESLSRSVTVSHGESRPVTECPTTGQDRTGVPTANAVGKARKRATRRVDQTKRPENFPDHLSSVGGDVLTVLRRIWNDRGGVEPQPRGVGLAIMRNERADHKRIAQELEHYLTSGRGVRARCQDVTKRYGDWVADAVAADRPSAAATVSDLDRKRLESARSLMSERGVG